MSEITLAERISPKYPHLKTQLRIAKINSTPVQFISNSLKFVLMYGIMLTIVLFFVFKKAGYSPLILVPAFFVLCFFLFQYTLLTIKSRIKKREKDIDREAVFVGRYLLVKLYSGRPLLNSLIETSKSKGLAAKYIREIVEEIDTGKTIEEALNNATTYSPSEKLRRILFHINNALQLGIDVTKPLESVIDELTKEEELEIGKYGKKLNTLVIFYMLVAIIIPSLGTAMFIVLASILNLPIDLNKLLIILFFIMVLQFIFITLFRGIRPTVDL